MTTVLERLATKFTIGDGCWEWTAGRNPDGYGHFRVGNTQRKAHRVVYELMIGPIPDGLDLDHLCRNRACVRPDHLEPVTRGENQRRGVPFRPPRDNNAWGRRVTHCPQGHQYPRPSEPGKKRNCLVCKRERMAAARRAAKGVA